MQRRFASPPRWSEAELEEMRQYATADFVANLIRLVFQQVQKAAQERWPNLMQLPERRKV